MFYVSTSWESSSQLTHIFMFQRGWLNLNHQPASTSYMLTAGFLVTPPIELPGGAHGSKPGTEVGGSSAGAVLQAAPGAPCRLLGDT